MIKFYINGKEVVANRGETILQVARREGFYIPTMCYLTKVKPIASCRICLVESAAKKQKITKTVLDVPASTKEITIEPTYKTIKVKKLVEKAQEIKTPIEAVYKMVNKKEKVSDSHQSWERILCQTNMNQDVILSIQKALKAKNYNPGKIDGVLGRDTRLALDKYQRDNSLSTGGITYETLKALDVEL